MTLPLAVELFHTGTVVDDIDAAMEQYTGNLGLAWATKVRRTGPVHTPDGPIHRDMVITYSQGGPHHVELIEYLDDTAYQHLTGGPPQQHVGFWSADFLGDIARLETQGLPCECSGVAADGGRAEFAYHRDRHSGLWIELVDDRARPQIEAWTRSRATEHQPDPPTPTPTEDVR